MPPSSKPSWASASTSPRRRPCSLATPTASGSAWAAKPNSGQFILVILFGDVHCPGVQETRNTPLIFDASRWPAREAIARVLGVVFVVLVVTRRVLQLPDWPGYIAEVRWLQPWFAKLSFLPPAILMPP